MSRGFSAKAEFLILCCTPKVLPSHEIEIEKKFCV